MDRMISLLAALVGLVALGASLLVYNNADANQQRLAAAIEELKASSAGVPARAEPIDGPDGRIIEVDSGTAEALLALQNRIVALETLTREQASALEEARTALANGVPSGGLGLASTALPTGGSAITAEGPTDDCIPMGTRFMATSGDSFPICQTLAVVNVSAVGEGQAIVSGAGSLVVGSSGQLNVPGCTIALLSADISGFAELRVTCI